MRKMYFKFLNSKATYACLASFLNTPTLRSLRRPRGDQMLRSLYRSGGNMCLDRTVIKISTDLKY